MSTEYDQWGFSLLCARKSVTMRNYEKSRESLESCIIEIMSETHRQVIKEIETGNKCKDISTYDQRS